MTAGVILDSYFRPTQVQGFDQGNRLVGADLGDRDKVGLVAVHASPFVHSDSMLQASLETHSGGSVCESKLTLITTAMSLSSGETEVVFGAQFDDLRSAQLPVPQYLLREK